MSRRLVRGARRRGWLWVPLHQPLGGYAGAVSRLDNHRSCDIPDLRIPTQSSQGHGIASAGENVHRNFPSDVQGTSMSPHESTNRGRQTLTLRVLMLMVAAPAMSAGMPVPVTAPRYDPVQTFAPLMLPLPNRYRSASGTPGPDYWQNRADYEIHAQLDPATKQLSASESITYTNHSPDVLTSLWLQLDQNTYRPDARSVTADNTRHSEFTDGLVIDALAVDYHGQTKKADYAVSDTRMQIRLSEALAGFGG